MVHVHTLIWELSDLEIKCELTGSGDSEAMNRDESERPEVNTRHQGRRRGLDRCSEK